MVIAANDFDLRSQVTELCIFANLRSYFYRIFMDSVGKGIARLVFGCLHSRLNVTDDRVYMARRGRAFQRGIYRTAALVPKNNDET